MGRFAKTVSEVLPLGDREFHVELTAIAPHLRAFARTLCGCRDRADDLAQETMLKAWSARSSYRPGTNFKAWTFTILRNQFYSEGRRARFTGEYDQEMAERTLFTHGNQEASVDLALVVSALSTLPETHRAALILAAVGGFGYDEIAEIVGVAVGTVKSRVCRARAMVEKALNGGTSPDARHDFVLEGDAMELLFSEMHRIANQAGEARRAA